MTRREEEREKRRRSKGRMRKKRGIEKEDLRLVTEGRGRGR